MEISGLPVDGLDFTNNENKLDNTSAADDLNKKISSVAAVGLPHFAEVMTATARASLDESRFSLVNSDEEGRPNSLPEGGELVLPPYRLSRSAPVEPVRQGSETDEGIVTTRPRGRTIRSGEQVPTELLPPAYRPEEDPIRPIGRRRSTTIRRGAQVPTELLPPVYRPEEDSRLPAGRGRSTSYRGGLGLPEYQPEGDIELEGRPRSRTIRSEAELPEYQPSAYTGGYESDAQEGAKRGRSRSSSVRSLEEFQARRTPSNTSTISAKSSEVDLPDFRAFFPEEEKHVKTFLYDIGLRDDALEVAFQILETSFGGSKVERSGDTQFTFTVDCKDGNTWGAIYRKMTPLHQKLLFSQFVILMPSSKENTQLTLRVNERDLRLESFRNLLSGRTS